MQAIILAGGKGTRLRPYTNFFPKPLVPIADVPILEILLRQLSRHGIKDVVLLTGHLAELIEAYFGDGSRLGIKIRYFRESKPLHTAGALAYVENLEEDFLVLNGDVLTTLDFSDIVATHKKSKAAATIAVFKRTVKIDFGVVEKDTDGNLVDYIEKPSYEKLVSMGVNVLNRRAVQHIKKGEPISMPELLMKLKNGKEKVKCYEFSDYWLDIGRVDDYEQAQKEFESGKKRFLQ